MDASVAAVTVSVVDPETLPRIAEIFVVPSAIEVASPFEPPALLIVATAEVPEFHVTVVVRICVEPSV